MKNINISIIKTSISAIKAKISFSRLLIAINATIILFMVAVSLNHLHRFTGYLFLSRGTLGLLGWLSITLTVINLSRKFIRASLLVFVVLFCVGYATGPYLEPPSDPLEHLKRTNSYCKVRPKWIRKTNHGFWHYYMSGVLLCSLNQQSPVKSHLDRIDTVHGLYWGLAGVTILIVGMSAGLSIQWALVSCLIAFLFMGTNRFSYFSYYSLAPSLSSMIIYWLWVSVFFFKRQKKNILLGTGVLIALIPILLVNHIQEAIFLIITGGIWIGVVFNKRIWTRIKDYKQANQKVFVTCLYILLIFCCFWILPQLQVFKDHLSEWFINTYWTSNRRYVFYMNEYHLIGKVWAYRISDTLGLLGFIPLFALPFLLLWRLIFKDSLISTPIVVLGTLPFWIYFVPLLNFIWASNVRSSYWRLCYASFYWLFIAAFLFGIISKISNINLGNSIFGKGQNRHRFVKKGIHVVFGLFCVVAIIGLSGVRSGPIYGKLDFYLVDNRPWWPDWGSMVNSVKSVQNLRKVRTDPVTATVLQSVFLQKAYFFRERTRKRLLGIEEMDNAIGEQKKTGRKDLCVINLVGFPDSWVPIETGHWQRDIGRTSLYYSYKGVTGDLLNQELKKDPPKYCKVFTSDDE